MPSRRPIQPTTPIAIYIDCASTTQLESHCTTATLHMYAPCSPAEVVGVTVQPVPLWLTHASLQQCFAKHGGWAPDGSAVASGAQAFAAHAASEASLLSVAASQSLSIFLPSFSLMV